MELNQDPARSYSSQYVLPVGDHIRVNYTYADTVPNTNPDYSTAWNNYFSNTLKMTRVGTSYTFPTSPTTLVINRYEIIIKSV